MHDATDPRAKLTETFKNRARFVNPAARLFGFPHELTVRGSKNIAQVLLVDDSNVICGLPETSPFKECAALAIPPLQVNAGYPLFIGLEFSFPGQRIGERKSGYVCKWGASSGAAIHSHSSGAQPDGDCTY